MKVSCTAKRLREIMEEKELRQVDVLNLSAPFCKKYGIKLNKSNLSQYLSGKTEPDQHKLYILGLALNVSEAWLMGYNVPKEKTDKEVFEDYNLDIIPLETKKFPLLGTVACGEPIYADEEHDAYICASSTINADFCLRAKGDSMIGAKINDGDIVFIKKQPIVEDGEIAVVLVDDEATLKRVFFDRENRILMLYAENPNIKPLRFVGDELNKVRILGKAVLCQFVVK